MRLKIYFATSLLLLLLLFILQNTEVVNLNFLVWQLSLSRALLLLLVFAIGLATGLLFGNLAGRRKAKPGGKLSRP
jgi:uncharacterized integral membrane protein